MDGMGMILVWLGMLLALVATVAILSFAVLKFIRRND
jgi:hypothetical protein